MDIFYFILRYIPFWAVPVSLISAQYGYMYWLKGIKFLAMCFGLMIFISVTSISFYYWVGGPDKAVEYFQKEILR